MEPGLEAGFLVFDIMDIPGTSVAISNCDGLVRLLAFCICVFAGVWVLPRSKRLLISWLQSPSAVILEPKKIKSDTVSPSISHEVMGPDAMILVF